MPIARRLCPGRPADGRGPGRTRLGGGPGGAAVPDRLDPRPVAAAGAAHGQLASPLGDGGLAVSAHKLVEEGARALLLYVPGLLRIDVRPVEDDAAGDPARRCATRSSRLGGASTPAISDYGQTAEETSQPAQVELPDGGARVGAASDRPGACSSPTRGRASTARRHFVGHAVMRGALADRDRILARSTETRSSAATSPSAAAATTRRRWTSTCAGSPTRSRRLRGSRPRERARRCRRAPPSRSG